MLWPRTRPSRRDDVADLDAETLCRPLPTRNELAKLYWFEFRRVYARLPLAKLVSLAAADAVEQERVIYAASTKSTYRNAAAQALAKLKKRAPVDIDAHAGTNEVVARRAENARTLAQQRVTAAQIEHLVIKPPVAKLLPEFLTEVPDGEGGSEPDQTGVIRQCERCKASFVVRAPISRDDREACKVRSRLSTSL